MRTRFSLLLLLAISLVMASCEKPVLNNDELAAHEKNANVVIRVTGFEQTSFDDYTPKRTVYSPTRSNSDITKLCSRVQFVVFKGDEKVKAVNQKTGDKDFGQVALSLAPGDYSVLVIAHNGTGNATISSVSKITFTNNVVSDTFYYLGRLTVGSSATQENLQLTRAVSMFRLTTTDPIPAEVKKMRFYYTGGSSTFDAEGGYGNVNSRQTVNIDVNSDMVGKPAQLDVFTFLHAEEGALNMTVTAHDSGDNVLYEKEFDAVPMRRNTITHYTGSFFGNGANASDGPTFIITADGEWEDGKSSTF